LGGCAATALNRVLLPRIVSSSPMGCCGSTATAPSETSEPASAPAPHVTERTRSRTGSRPEWTHRSRKSLQDLNPRSKAKSAPQLPESSKSSSPQNPRTRAEALPVPKMSNYRRPDVRPMPGENDG
jgi:hypothetical protein